MEIQYRKLHDGNFNQNTLDGFIRHQAVKECWRKINGAWRLVPNEFEENWSLQVCREIAADVARHMNRDQTAFGAFDCTLAAEVNETLAAAGPAMRSWSMCFRLLAKKNFLKNGIVQRRYRLEGLYRVAEKYSDEFFRKYRHYGDPGGVLRRWRNGQDAVMDQVLGINEEAGTGLIASLASIFPALALVKEMDSKGKLLVFAFAVPAAYTFGDHLGYVASVESGMVLPMITAKLTAGILALLLANLLADRVLKQE